MFLLLRLLSNNPSVIVKQVSREAILPAKSRERGAHSRMIPDVLINSTGPRQGSRGLSIPVRPVLSPPLPRNFINKDTNERLRANLSRETSEGPRRSLGTPVPPPPPKCNLDVDERYGEREGRVVHSAGGR